MGMNDTASAERMHIGFFGLRNSGKSSLVNAITGQDLSLVSDIKGTTTDPVRKTMELLPLGPVVIVDTPGIDDEGALGEMRVKKALQVLNYIDIAVLVVDSVKGLGALDKTLIQQFKEKDIQYIIAYNKSELINNQKSDIYNEIFVSAKNKTNIYQLKEMITHLIKNNETDRHIVSDLISPGDVVVLVVPIDSAAPKGRLILPQQQTIRELLEAGAVSVVTREKELSHTLSTLTQKPKMVITDSQVFGIAAKDTPSDVLLTSFSILFMRYKGNLNTAVEGANTLNNLHDNDTILISEGCTHHRQCEDIGTVKLPAWIKSYTGKNINFEFTSGRDFPEDVSKYSLVIHCGGCMLNERELKSRMHYCKDCGVPFTNYGVAIAKIHGILERSLEVFS